MSDSLSKCVTECPLEERTVVLSYCERCRWFRFWSAGFLRPLDDPGYVVCYGRRSKPLSGWAWLRARLGRSG